jgi:hypothetical protein
MAEEMEGVEDGEAEEGGGGGGIVGGDGAGAADFANFIDSSALNLLIETLHSAKAAI